MAYACIAMPPGVSGVKHDSPGNITNKQIVDEIPINRHTIGTAGFHSFYPDGELPMKMKLLMTVAFVLMFVPTAFASHYDILDIDIVPAEVSQKLVADKVSNTEELFAMLIKKADRTAFAQKYGMPEADVEKLAKTLELMQIVGVGPKAATLLQLAGITSLKALTEASPSELLDVLLRVNREHNITGVQPDLTVVRDWIDKSKKVVNHME